MNGLDKWWESRRPPERAVLRDMIRLAKDLFDGEVLKVKFTGGCLSLVVVSNRRRSMLEPGRTGGRFCDVAPEPEKWWAGLSGKQQILIRELAKQIDDLVQHRDETLELVITGNGFEAVQALRAKWPADGKGSLN